MFIRDTIPLKIRKSEKAIVEDVNGNPSNVLRLVGKVQEAECPNANGRIYPLDVLRGALDGAKVNLSERRMLGESDHPPDAKIHLHRVLHVVTKLWLEGNTMYGEIEVLDRLPKGKELRALVESNINVGISSRGVGDMQTIEHAGQEYYSVCPGYELITFDVVAVPSVEGSYLSIAEGKNHKRRKVDVKRKREREVLKEFKNYFARIV